ncbi:MAG: hypothetical protein ABW224_16715 [Kibdelosporangium sp.]
MSSLTSPTFGSLDHPAGQVVLFQRDVRSKVNALAGYRVDTVVGRTLISRVDQSHSALADSPS